MLTLYDALALSTLAGAEILAGASGLSRMVQRAVVIEVPNVLIQTAAGDLLMTSVDTFQPHQAEFLSWMTSLNDLHAAGILVKGALSQDVITHELIEVANAINLPLISLPRSVSYNEIILALAAEQLERQAKLLRRSEGLRQRFMSAVLSGGGLRQIVEFLSLEVGSNSVILTDSLHHPLHTYCPAHESDTGGTVYRCLRLPEAVEEAQLVEISQTLAVVPANPRSLFPDSDWEAQWLRWTVAIDQLNLGYVYLYGCCRPLTHADTLVLERVSDLAALEMLKLRVQREVGARRTEFVHGLMTGFAEKAEQLSRSARALQWQITLPLQIFVFSVSLPPLTIPEANLSKLAATVLPSPHQQDLFWPYESGVVLAYRSLAAHAMNRALRSPSACKKRLGNMSGWMCGLGLDRSRRPSSKSPSLMPRRTRRCVSAGTWRMNTA